MFLVSRAHTPPCHHRRTHTAQHDTHCTPPHPAPTPRAHTHTRPTHPCIHTHTHTVHAQAPNERAARTVGRGRGKREGVVVSEWQRGTSARCGACSLCVCVRAHKHMQPRSSFLVANGGFYAKRSRRMRSGRPPTSVPAAPRAADASWALEYLAEAVPRERPLEDRCTCSSVTVP